MKNVIKKGTLSSNNNEIATKMPTLYGPRLSLDAQAAGAYKKYQTQIKSARVTTGAMHDLKGLLSNNIK
jgi:hypothetical protein